MKYAYINVAYFIVGFSPMTRVPEICAENTVPTRSSAVTERLHDAACH